MDKKTLTSKSFVLFKDFNDTLKKLTDDQAGKLIKAIFHWQINGELPEIDITTDLVITPIIAQFKRDNDKYINICERNRENGNKSQGRPRKPKKPTGLIGIPDKPKKPYTDTDTDTDNNTDNKNISSLPAKAVELTDILIASVIEQNPNAKNINANYNKTRLSWASEIDKMNRIDGRSFDDIERVINWAVNDSFWKLNIKSGSKLREKYDDLIPRVNMKYQPTNTKRVTKDKDYGEGW